jgi:hypothetical protein
MNKVNSQTHWERKYFDLAWPDKDTMVWGTGKVGDVLDRAVVFAVGGIELDSNPLAWRKRRCSHKAHDPPPRCHVNHRIQWNVVLHRRASLIQVYVSL